MRNLLSTIFLILLASFSFAQKDVIHLKDGTKIKCRIAEIDTSAKVIVYYAIGDSLKSTLPSSEVEYYQKRGFFDEKTKTSYNKLKDNFNVTDDIYFSETETVTRLSTPGSHLAYFADNAQVGLGLMMAGTIITAVPWLITNNNPDNADNFATKQKTIAMVGAGISLVGFIVHFSSYSHARKAGKLMDITPELSLNLTDTGLGISIPIIYR